MLFIFDAFKDVNWFACCQLLRRDFRILFPVQLASISLSLYVTFSLVSERSEERGIIEGEVLEDQFFDNRNLSDDGLFLALLDAGKSPEVGSLIKEEPQVVDNVTIAMDIEKCKL